MGVIVWQLYPAATRVDESEVNHSLWNVGSTPSCPGMETAPRSAIHDWIPAIWRWTQTAKAMGWLLHEHAH
jgi:hypothetical protein